MATQQSTIPRSNSYEPGDHLAVRRSWLYYHHGIYVSDERVIQFGGRISDKPRASIGAVSLSDFARGGKVSVVRHDLLRTGTRAQARLREAEPREKVIQKAEWLLEHHSEWLRTRSLSRYNLIGNNCEHAATFCATYGRAESLQVSLVVNGAGLVGILLALSGLMDERNWRLPRWIKVPIWTVAFVNPVGSRWHNWIKRRMWRQIMTEWDVVERSRPRLFERGEHLVGVDERNRVRHGIYVTEGRVIQFGIGPSPDIYARAVPLAEFDAGDEAAGVIVHWQRDHSSDAWFIRSDSPDQVVGKAEWLLASCANLDALATGKGEQAANWCATGDHRITDVSFRKVDTRAAQVFLSRKKWSPLRLVLACIFQSDGFFEQLRNLEASSAWRIIATNFQER